MPQPEAPFFDAQLAQQQRQSLFNLTTGTAQLETQRDRMQQDANLMRPFMERRFARQANRMMEGVAGQGFHGQSSGIRNTKQADLATEQTFTSGQFELGLARGEEDIATAIQNLTDWHTITSAENVRGGAGRASASAWNAAPY